MIQVMEKVVSSLNLLNANYSMGNWDVAHFDFYIIADTEESFVLLATFLE